MDISFKAVVIGCCLLIANARHIDPLDHGYSVHSNKGMLKFVLNLLSQHPDQVIKFYKDLGNEIQRPITQDVYKNIPMPFDDACTQCGALIDMLKTVVVEVDKDTLGKFLLPLCIALLNDMGMNGRIMCQPVINNYIDHVYFIFENLNKGGVESCELLNFCSTSLAKNPVLYNRRQQAIPNEIKDIFKTFHAPLLPVKANKMENIEEHEKRSVIKIAHLTDIHVENVYVDSSPTSCDLYVCCRDEGSGASGSAHPYGDYNCNIPARTVEMFLDFISSHDPDIVVYTGDSPPHAIWAETLEGQRNEAQWIANAIIQKFPVKPIYPAYGNHECFPTNMYYAPDADTKNLTEAFFDSWKNSAGFGMQQEQTITNGGYYSIDSTFPDLKVVTVNSNYGYVDNWYNLLNDEDAAFLKMKDDTEAALQDAKNAGHKVLLLLHHNSGSNVIHYDQWISDISVRYKDIIPVALMGHTHDDEFKLIIDPANGEAVATHLTAPSMDSHGGTNPGARIVYLDGTTYEPLDYEQYRIDLDELTGNPNMEPNITLLYKASDLYNISNLSPASMYELTERFEEDDDLFNLYYGRKSLRPESARECLDSCKTNQICRIRSATLEQYRACQDANNDDGSGSDTDTTPDTSTSDVTTEESSPTTPADQYTTEENSSDRTTSFPVLLLIALLSSFFSSF